jgi:hypothetical protein
MDGFYMQEIDYSELESKLEYDEEKGCWKCLETGKYGVVTQGESKDVVIFTEVKNELE